MAIINGGYVSDEMIEERDRRLKKILELLQSGLPSVFAMASSVVIVFIMNRLLKNVGGRSRIRA